LSGDKTGVATSPDRSRGRGIAMAAGCYLLWGLFPIYWKLLEGVSSLEVLAHRVFWAAVFLLLTCLVIRRSQLASLLRQRRAVLILLTTGILVTANWGIFIYAINANHIIQTSMGYFINPLLNILIGVVLFKEKLTLAQKAAALLATAGVIFFTFDYGSFPWISIALASTFALYGALKKLGGYPALPALTLETLLVTPLALAFIVATFFIPGHAFLAVDASGGISGAAIVTALLLAGGGIVTLIPLLMFADGVNNIPLSWMGFFQYLSPTLTLLLGVFVYHEPFTLAHAVCFTCIWLGLLLIIVETLVMHRKKALTSGADEGA
jgi:chloramphenicol-sensitive protein RarD